MGNVLLDTEPVAVGPPLRWFGLITLPPLVGRPLLRSTLELGDWLGPTRNWVLVGFLLGILPLAGDYLTRCYGSWLITPFLLMPPLLAAVRRDGTLQGLGLLTATLAGHSGVVICLAAWQPEIWGAIFPAGAAYWDKSQLWILTGISEEYDPGYWLPAQFQLGGVMIFFTYLSLGLTPLWQGFHEVDLMNTYVGRLLVQSSDSRVVLAVGWHPWSVCRGLGYLFLTFEMTSLAFEQLTGKRLSTGRSRKMRWLAAIVFLGLDMLSKYFLLEPVRNLLAANLNS